MSFPYSFFGLAAVWVLRLLSQQNNFCGLFHGKPLRDFIFMELCYRILCLISTLAIYCWYHLRSLSLIYLYRFPTVCLQNACPIVLSFPFSLSLSASSALLDSCNSLLTDFTASSLCYSQFILGPGDTLNLPQTTLCTHYSHPPALIRALHSFASVFKFLSLTIKTSLVDFSLTLPLDLSLPLLTFFLQPN